MPKPRKGDLVRINKRGYIWDGYVGEVLSYNKENALNLRVIAPFYFFPKRMQSLTPKDIEILDSKKQHSAITNKEKTKTTRAAKKAE